MLTRQFAVIFISLILLVPQLTIDAKPLPGRKRAFGVGILTGALAGAAVGHVLSHHHQQQQQKQLENSNGQVTTIEKGATMSNGCYKQTVKEPDAHDSRRMIETVHLICPPGVQAVQTMPVASVVQIPVAPVTNVVPVIPVPMGPSASIPVPVPQTYSIVQSPAVPTQQTQQPQLQQPQPQLQQPQLQQQQPQLQQQPVFITSNNPPVQPATPQVFILSKKSVKKNSANNILKANFIMILIVAAILLCLY